MGAAELVRSKLHMRGEVCGWRLVWVDIGRFHAVQLNFEKTLPGGLAQAMPRLTQEMLCDPLGFDLVNWLEARLPIMEKRLIAMRPGPLKPKAKK
jgi:hypothetical protein